MNIKNKKLLLIDNMNVVDGQGGVEHVLCNMANVMSRAGMNVLLATMENKIGVPFYSLDEKVKFYNIYQKKNIFEKIKRELTPKRKRYLRELKYKAGLWDNFIKLQKPDIIICFSLPTLLEVTYNKNYNIPVILTIHGDPSNDYTNRFDFRPDYMNELYKEAYAKADCIQVLLDSYKNTVPNTFKGKLYTIANVAPYNDYTIDYNKSGIKKIVCIASLCDRKHQDLLINAFSCIAKDYPDWILELWGSGDKKEVYKNIINNNQMSDRIFLKGSTRNSYKVLKDTDIFALPSTCEGWPLVLGEAMSMGIPCVGLEICDGVNEIIRNNENGLLSNDSINIFSEKLKILMNSKILRKQYGLQSKKDMDSYAPDIIWNKWKELISITLENYTS